MACVISRIAHSPALRWLGRVSLVAAIAAIVFWVHLFEFKGENRWDSAAFLAIGKLLQRGLLLYRDLWDTKPPGIYIYQSAVFAVLPIEVWSLRLTDYLLYVAAGAVFYRLCTVAARWPLALAGTAVWLTVAHHPSFNIAGFYTEEYAAICAIGAVAAATRYWRHGGLGWVIVSGVGIAAAVIFKHPGIACAVPVAVLLSGRRPLVALPLAAFSAAVPIVLVVGYFWWHGALAPFLDCQLVQLLVQHGVLDDPHPKPLSFRVQELGWKTYALLRLYTALFWPAAFGSIVCLLRPNRFRLAALLWMLTDLLLIGAQKFYFEHYYIQIFPSAVLVGVIGAAWLLQSRAREGWLVAAPRLALCVAVAAFAWIELNSLLARRQPVLNKAWAALRAGPASWPQHPGGALEEDVGRYLNERTSPDDRIFIFETGTGLAVFWTADRLPASRYIFSIIPQGSPARQIEQLAELERTRPAYIAITGNWAWRYFTPYLLANYTLATVRSGEYRMEIWARNDRVGFASGALDGLSADAQRGGLVLPGPPAPPAAPLLEADHSVTGTWTSPVIEVVGGGGELALNWNPRRDLAANPSAIGMPNAVASTTLAGSDPKAVLGAPTRSGRWSTFPKPGPQSLTIDFGFPAVADRVALRSVLNPDDTVAERFHLLAGDGRGGFAPLDGEWEPAADGNATYRFAPQALSSLRIIATPVDAQRAVALQRVRVTAVGMGVGVRYRTGLAPDLSAAPWVAVEDEEEVRVIPAQRYVQIECDVWSSYQGRSPVLRELQVGRLLFQLDPGSEGSEPPLRTAGAPASPPTA
jgi:hypothetical protein